MEPFYRLIFLDIDGTLVLPGGEMTERTLRAVRAAQECGSTPVLCTGRNRHSATLVARQIGGRGYGIILNGALVFDWETGEVLRRSLVPVDAARHAILIAREFGLGSVLYGTEENQDNSIFTDHMAPLPERYRERNAYRLVYLNDVADEMPVEPASLVAYGTPEETTATAAAWRYQISDPITAYAGPTGGYDCWYAQITSSDADKAIAAGAVAESLGVPRERTMAIGDQANDEAMLRWAGLGVCMGDGQPEARACADHVTGALAEDGAAQAIETFVLGAGAAGPAHA